MNRKPSNPNSNLASSTKEHQGRGFTFALEAAMTTLACLLGLALVNSFRFPTPSIIGGFILSRVSCSLGFLVTVVGAVVVKYSDRYLNGDPRQAEFHRWLALSVTSALCVMLADNLLVLVGGWAITSVGLHYLLTHYRSEPDAVKVARKKFLISRLGDVALLVAMISIYRTCGTLSLTHLFDQMRESHQIPITAVWCICLAAITKSAQFPFHTWLPDTLAAPTPVSALMHAGIINGGGALLLKFAPAIVETPTAGIFLAMVGSVTMAVGMVSMWGQTSVKRKLAWSTVSQMGFMTAECGISAFVAALIHILGHGLYKATAFLESGTPDPIAPAPRRLTGLGQLGLLVTGCALSIPIQFGIHSGAVLPAQGAVIAMTGLAIGHLWVAMHAHLSKNSSRPLNWITMLTASQLLGLLSALMFRVATEIFDLPLPPSSQMATITCAIPVLTLLGLSLYRTFEAEISASATGQALIIHSQNGFYIGLVADRLVARICSPLLTKI